MRSFKTTSHPALFLSALLFLANFSSRGQELPRSVSFGAMVANLDDSTRIALRLPSLSGTLIRKVTEGSSAQKAGFVENDVIVSMDGADIKNTGDFLAHLKTHAGGDKVKINYYRNSRLKNATVSLLPRQMEKSEDYDIIYSSVWSGKNHLRTITTRPKGQGIYPAVLIVGGVGCYSIDNPTVKEIQSIKLWVDSLTRNGFVTVRIEKTGMGDSKGIPCNQCDFNTEKQAFLDGLKQLKSQPFVDPKNVFIAGFSMGGVIAPLISQEEPVKGIIVYGTVGRNWLEYEIENSFRQQRLEGRPADSIDLFMRADYKRLYGLFVEKKQPQQIIAEHPETRPNLFMYPMRIEYFQQVADIDIGRLWMRTNAKVLALHGSSDFVSSGPEHELIAAVVNQYHPGNATYLEIGNADHWGLWAENEQASFLHQQKELNPLPLQACLKWLKANS